MTGKQLTNDQLNALNKGKKGTQEDLERVVVEDKGNRLKQRAEILHNYPTFESIGGYKQQKEDLYSIGHVSQNSDAYKESFGGIPNRGIYLIGPNGVGKTMLAKSLIKKNFDVLAKEFPDLEVMLRGDESLGEKIADKLKSKGGKTFYYDAIDAGQLVGPMPQMTEKMVREYLTKAASADYAVIVLERIEGLLPADTQAGPSSTIVGSILEMIDGYLKKNPHLVVIGTTSNSSKVDKSTSSVLTKRIDMGAPDDTERLEIIGVCTHGLKIAEDVKLEELTKLTAGYVGSDLANVCDEAVNTSAKRSGFEQKINELRKRFGIKYAESNDYKQLCASQKITIDDFKKALAKYKPSLFVGYTLETPNIKLEDVAGMEELKEDTKLWLETCVSNQWINEACGLPKESNSYWLMVGPPGTGKTHYAKALAGEVGATFISVKAGELLDKYVGETEKAIREIFKRAREAKKAVIFWDEIDAIAAKRGSGEHHDDSFTTTLLTELEGVQGNENVVFIAATNRPDQLDDGFVSRMHRTMYLGLPDAEQIKGIIKINLGLTGNPRHAKNAPKKLYPDISNEIDGLAKELEERKYSCRDVDHLIKGAKEEMAKRIAKKVNQGIEGAEIENSCVLTPEDLKAAVEKITPGRYDEDYWLEMARKFNLVGFKKKETQ